MRKRGRERERMNHGGVDSLDNGSGSKCDEISTTGKERRRWRES